MKTEFLEFEFGDEAVSDESGLGGQFSNRVDKFKYLGSVMKKMGK